MKVIGFRELHWHDAPDGPSLREVARTQPHPDEARVIAYLRAGKVFAVRPMVVGDFLRPEREMVSASHWHTDGEWVWPTDLAYYVQEYHTELPVEFVDRMVAAGWVCPVLSPEQIRSVGRWWVHSRGPQEAGPAAPDRC